MDQELMRTGDAEGTPALYADFAGLEHILLGDLRQLLSEPLTEPSRVWMEKVLDLLLELLPGRFAAEEADGYLQEVLDAFPHWHERVASLQRQHAELQQNLAELRDELRSSQLAGAAASRVRNGLRAWMQQFQSHQDAEMKLLNAEGVSPTLAL